MAVTGMITPVLQKADNVNFNKRLKAAAEKILYCSLRILLIYFYM